MGTNNAAMQSFWVEDGGALLSEMGSGIMAAGEFSSWTGAYNGAVDNAAAQYEQRIMMHMAVNGGDVNVAIVSASGFGMVLSDVLGTTNADEFRTGLNYGNGATLDDLERLQKGLILGSQLAVGGASGARFVGPRSTAVTSELSCPSTSSTARSAGRTEVVQRWMSEGGLRMMQETGLLRGGRDGTHFVSDFANSDPLRARQRLALPQTPEVRVTFEVPEGIFSTPTRVEQMYNMPGGGMERIGIGKVPIRINGVHRK